MRWWWCVLRMPMTLRFFGRCLPVRAPVWPQGRLLRNPWWALIHQGLRDSPQDADQLRIARVPHSAAAGLAAFDSSSASGS